MRVLPLVLALVFAAFAPQALGLGKPEKTPEMSLEVAVKPEAEALVGGSSVVEVTVVPPEGIALNRYPGITLTIDDDARLGLADKVAFVGVKKPIKDVSKFQFETIPPLELKVAPKSRGGSERTMKGTLKFFYCVKKSGFCAPGEQKVKIPVRVAKK
jgi:hypothetical protein